MVFLLAILLPNSVYATASSASVVYDRTIQGTDIRIIKMKFTAASTDGSNSNLVLYAGGNYTSTSGLNKPLLSWKLKYVHIDGDHGGTHDGSNNAATLSDADAGFEPGEWIGATITNSTDGSSSGTITANTGTTVTVTLSGGTDHDFDNGDTYQISVEPTENSEIYIYQKGMDLLGGNGANNVDNTTENDVYTYINTVPAFLPIIDDLTVIITQQSVATNSAVVFVYLILEK